YEYIYTILFFRILRRQHRVRIHLNLFISFIVRNIVVILWDNLVYNNRLHNLAKETLMHQNTVGCKILYILTRYTQAANFSWMFLEGFHLHRLIVRAFKVPKSINGYYLAGWVSPVLPVLIYSMIRIYRQDQECWVQNTGYYEWILYVPNLLCILVNVFFLCGILRILLNQLQTHPNEPNNYRKALKASFVLVPLFGVQLFLVIYRPPPDLDISYPFEILSEIMSNSQGVLVSLLLCFFNHEVRAHLRGTLPVLRKDVGLKLGALRSSTKKNYLTNANEDNDITSCKSRLDPGPKSEQPESYQNNRAHTLCLLTNKCVVAVDNHN
ncbi:calcitonin gene-related peptide type 1 receptor, partial [Patella vulgata]|uniref:calcitonin gene-related peptide type 1 receptor n=1 Tax=Patella vulgata TaxID=6465 RepID=UPI00218067C0